MNDNYIFSSAKKVLKLFTDFDIELTHFSFYTKIGKDKLKLIIHNRRAINWKDNGKYFSLCDGECIVAI